MNERKARGHIPESGGKQEEEILDIADLLEDLPEDDAAPEEVGTAAAGEDAHGAGDDEDFDLEAIFSDLDEALPDEDEEIIDLVDLADEELPGGALSAGGAFGEESDGLEDFSFEDLAPGEAAVTDVEDDLDLSEDFISASELDELLGDAPAPPEDTASAVERAVLAAGDVDLLEDRSAGGSEAASRAVIGSAAAGAVPGSGSDGALSDITLTDDRIDAAVERVIRKMYAEKIDAILVEAVERTVNREISRLKAIINRGAPDR